MCMDSMSPVSSVLAVGVLKGQPVNSVPQVPLNCIAKSGRFFLLPCPFAVDCVSPCTLQSAVAPTWML